MKDIIRFGLILMVVASVAAAGLSAVYTVTQPRILEQERAKLNAALAVALPGCDPEHFKPAMSDGAVLFYKGYGTEDTTKLFGYAYVAKGIGYADTIKTMVGVDSSGTIIGMKVISQKETPGLGTKVQQIKYGETDPWFTRQFQRLSASDLAVDKDGGEIVSITAATISSRALAKSVVEGYDKLLNDIQANP